MSAKVNPKTTCYVAQGIEVVAVTSNDQAEKLIARTQAVVEKITKESNPVAHNSPPRPSRRVVAELLPAIPNLPIQNSVDTFAEPNLTRPITPPILDKRDASLLEKSPSKAAAGQLQMMGLRGVEDPLVRMERLTHMTFKAFQGGRKLSFSQLPVLPSIETGKSSIEADKQSGFLVKGNAILPKQQQNGYIVKFIESCKKTFFEFAKSNSSKPDLKFIDFNRSFQALSDILVNLESKDFLDAYIVRDSDVGLNKDPLMKKKLEAFKGKLDTLQAALNNIGIKSLEEGKSVNFWSGREGQRRASDDEESFSDSDIPFFKYLFDCWGYLKTHEMAQTSSEQSNFTALLPSLFSSIFATYAKGAVNVYMASKNKSEAKESVINVDSAFWSAELYSLRNNPDVTQVNLYLHEGVDAAGKDLWSEPLDLKSLDPEMKTKIDSKIKLSRRDSELAVPVAKVKGVAKIWKKGSKSSLDIPFTSEAASSN